MSQIDNLLSSLATATTDYSLGWNLIEVIGYVCQLKVSSYSSAPSDTNLKSQTLTLESSDPVTSKWEAILFQSKTLTSLLCALMHICAFLGLPTRISTTCNVPSDEPKNNMKCTSSKNELLIGWKDYILYWTLMVCVGLRGRPLTVTRIVG